MTTGPSPGPTNARLNVGDYQYTLEIRCFCRNAGAPIRVTVEAQIAVRGVYLESGDNYAADQPSPRYTWLTLNEVIEAANDHTAYHVTVDWPKGQRWPDSVSVDPQKNTIDEEYGYTVYDVDLS